MPWLDNSRQFERVFVHDRGVIAVAMDEQNPFCDGSRQIAFERSLSFGPRVTPVTR
jgi:hypothetical protein